MLQKIDDDPLTFLWFSPILFIADLILLRGIWHNEPPWHTPFQYKSEVMLVNGMLFLFIVEYYVTYTYNSVSSLVTDVTNQ